MKKILVVLSLVCFIGVNISKAQTAAATTQKEVKTEASAVKADAPAMHSCCQHANAACCKNKTASSSKECTPAQKAACEKMGSKAKAEAQTEKESKAKGSN